jgi:hypothetical protein
MVRLTKNQPGRNMPQKASERFILRLNKGFGEKDIRLAYVYDDKETLTVDGELIDLMWMPHIDVMADPEVLKVLYRDCKKAIKEHLKIDN